MPITFICFFVSALSLTGIPLFAGFISKYYLASAALSINNKLAFVGIIALIISALLTDVFFTLVMVVAALFREVLGNASFCGNKIEFLNDYKISALAGAFGGYLVLAIITAVMNKITKKLEKEEI
jgi:formate hydrogenlyase subunit 3/multisubunit Na+/H+ antiporter MnhD subunit